MSDVPDDYDDWNVQQLRSNVSDTDDAETLAEWREYEAENKDRVTAIEAIDERLEALDWDGETSDDDQSELLEAEDGEDEDGDDEDEGGDGEELDGHEAYKESKGEGAHITVKNPRGDDRTIAHVEFGPHEAKTVRNNRYIREALRRGRLQFVRNH